MTRLPVIVGAGGISCAGRSSFHLGYSRIVADALSEKVGDEMYRSLAWLMGAPLDSEREMLRRGTLVRRIEPELLTVDELCRNRRLKGVMPESLGFELDASRAPRDFPADWKLERLSDQRVRVTVDKADSLLWPEHYESSVKAAGQLPAGFDPGKGYASHHHPRGLKMAIFGASDAIRSVGIDWEQIVDRVGRAYIGVYAGSAMGQLDASGTGGMLISRHIGKKTSAKHCPLGFVQMTADFINAYVLGNLGKTSSNAGACASFLYNLQQAVNDIQSGTVRVAVVGNSEAPITAEIIEGYAAMGALATDAKLHALDQLAAGVSPDHRRACRPFAPNCGFVVAESAQFIVLMDDELALESGATMLGAVPAVFVHADGFKRSIAAPGTGNYVSMANAVAYANALLGEQRLRSNTYVQAHGSGTPQNRVTESHILDSVAGAFKIRNWPVSAIKSYLGHSIGTAAGDQIMSSLGVWEHGVIPGIHTLDKVADDVSASNLQLSAEHKQVGRAMMDAVFVNAKGFGGNNATALVLSPDIVRKKLAKRHGKLRMSDYARRNESVRNCAQQYKECILRGEDVPIYRFGEGVEDHERIHVDTQHVWIDGENVRVALSDAMPYSDLIE